MDLIGYDHFEVVGEMLENRLSLVSSVLDNPALLAHEGVYICSSVHVNRGSLLLQCSVLIRALDC